VVSRYGLDLSDVWAESFAANVIRPQSRHRTA